MITMPKVLTVRITEKEFDAFVALCGKHHLSKQELLHSIIVDALLDEGLMNDLRCKQSKGCQGGREAISASGAAAA